jgi:hypothetical protein
VRRKPNMARRAKPGTPALQVPILPPLLFPAITGFAVGLTGWTLLRGVLECRRKRCHARDAIRGDQASTGAETRPGFVPSASAAAKSRNPGCSIRRCLRRAYSGLCRLSSSSLSFCFACPTCRGSRRKSTRCIRGREARSGPPRLSPTAYPEGAFLPLVATDMPARCAGRSPEDACRDVIAEFNGGYGAIKCGYDVSGTGRKRFYFFWLNKVPSHLVAMARNDPKASVRALGSAAVQRCPPTLEAADSQYKQNIQ